MFLEDKIGFYDIPAPGRGGPGRRCRRTQDPALENDSGG